ncbi:S46 family peptidase [Pollutibacter soli]|uniref:S46 family peptidase n=1 Tax=Pollutibacter soli TaxID=3034157 RepID=UPI00301344E6
MKKSLVALISFFISLCCIAEEGMWLPMLLGQDVYNDMVKKGLLLTKEQLYSINKPSIKDGIIMFNRGCSGGVVSNEGLIFTNHHCGYDAIADASSVQNNYLKDGFYAKSKADEIPAKHVTVEFLVSVEDFTSKIDSATNGLSVTDRAKKILELTEEINSQYSKPDQFIKAELKSIFKGNQYLLFVYQEYRDIRLVGAPPESVGNYGGDTDNWEWPRHTGDFSIFRIYTGKDGKPAEYATDNIPFKPKYFLPISVKGVKDGDYAMTYGYPGSTNRYETSYGVALKTTVENPALVELRDVRLKLMLAEMKKDPATRLQLSSAHSTISNYWKFFDGETKQLIKYNILQRKQAEEATFQQWAKGKPVYENLFPDWQKAYDQWKPYAAHRMYIREGILGSPLLAFANSLANLEASLVRKGPDHADTKKALAAASARREEFIKDENIASDKKILAEMLSMFYQNIDKNQHPIGFYENVRNTYGDLKDQSTWDKYAANVFGTTFLLDDSKWKAFASRPDANQLQNDAAYSIADKFIKNYDSKYNPYFTRFTASNNEYSRIYLKGLREMSPTKKMYPDATFTMRLSYGSVKNYQPRDAVKYDYVCTMTGVLEKYRAGDFEFELPAKLRELAAKKDYGTYIDKSRNDLVVTFITTNDITGGNSGSPVLNGKGELIGLSFDGNYEAISHKLAFDKNLNRTICVDVRYILWCIDKLGGAGYLLKELSLR